jgi:hypothetical protein
VINQALLLNSQVSVGTVIFAVTSEVALAQKVLTVVQFFWIVNVAFHIVGCQVKSQYLPLVATAHKLGVQVKSQYLPLVATGQKLSAL